MRKLLYVISFLLVLVTGFLPYSLDQNNEIGQMLLEMSTIMTILMILVDIAALVVIFNKDKKIGLFLNSVILITLIIVLALPKTHFITESVHVKIRMYFGFYALILSIILYSFGEFIHIKEIWTKSK